MTTIKPCQAKNPATCRYHGGEAYLLAQVEKAQQNVKKVYSELQADPNLNPWDSIQKRTAAKAEVDKAVARLEALDGRFEEMARETAVEKLKIELGIGSQNAKLEQKYKDLDDKLKAASYYREKAYHDASSPFLEAMPNPPLSRAAARKLFDKEDGGAFVGVVNNDNLTAAGEQLHTVIGTKSYQNFTSSGRAASTGVIRPLSSNPLPDIENTAARWGDNASDPRNIVGWIPWRTVIPATESKTSPVITEHGYQIITKSYVIRVNLTGGVEEAIRVKTI
jgi:hypothetical protein